MLTKKSLLRMTQRPDPSAIEHSRRIFCKSALAIFDDQPPVILRTTDISYFDVYVISPIHAKKTTTCWLQLTIPTSSEENQTFEIKTKVLSSVYSRKKNGFIIGLSFLKPERAMIKLISRIK